MKRFSEKSTLLFFYGFDFLLVAVFALIFFPLSRRNSPDTMELNFVSEDDAKKIDGVEFSWKAEGTKIVLQKENGIWLGTDGDSNQTLIWPADENLVEKFFSAAGENLHPVKKADKVSAWKNLGVDDLNSYRVTFFSGGQKISEFRFGKTDEVSGEIAIRTSENQTVWAAKTSLTDFLFETDASFWADPFVEPEAATGKTRTENSSSLRRGKLVYISPSQNIKPEFVVKKNFPNGTDAVYSVYKKDDFFVVIPSFFSAQNESMKKIDYRFSVSPVTLEKFLEEAD